jgi:hypothetical protein
MVNHSTIVTICAQGKLRGILRVFEGCSKCKTKTFGERVLIPRTHQVFLFWTLVFWIFDLFSISDLGFRIYNLTLSSVQAVLPLQR